MKGFRCAAGAAALAAVVAGVPAHAQDTLKIAIGQINNAPE